LCPWPFLTPFVRPPIFRCDLQALGSLGPKLYDSLQRRRGANDLFEHERLVNLLLEHYVFVVQLISQTLDFFKRLLQVGSRTLPATRMAQTATTVLSTSSTTAPASWSIVVSATIATTQGKKSRISVVG
jgi:hypothetical protein